MLLKFRKKLNPNVEKKDEQDSVQWTFSPVSLLYTMVETCEYSLVQTYKAGKSLVYVNSGLQVIINQ